MPLDLRFTRCTPTAVNACLSPLGFRPSDNNSLFHPAPLSLALCSLEKVALTASDPISLYSCPSQSVFRLHIDKLNHLPAHTKKVVPVSSPSTSQSTIRTISSAEDTVVFIPPPRKQAKNDSFPPVIPSVSVPVPASSPIDPPTHPSLVSNVSSFYENSPTWNGHSRKSILPLSAQAVQSSGGGKLDPLAIARPPPPWKILDAYTSPAPLDSHVTPPCRRSASDIVENSRRARTGQALDNPLQVDRHRLHKRGSDAVADMAHQFKSKRLRVESEFALAAKTRAKVAIKSHNPFARSARSVFAESSTNTYEPRSLVHEPSKEAEPHVQLRACRSLPSKTVQQQGANVAGTLKSLKPITMLKPPILPKELLPSLPQHTSKTRTTLKQTRLDFLDK